MLLYKRESLQITFTVPLRSFTFYNNFPFRSEERDRFDIFKEMIDTVYIIS